MNTSDKEFAAISESLYEEIYTYVKEMVLFGDMIEDVLQDTFLLVYKNLTFIHPLKEDEKRAYIFTIAKNCLIKAVLKELKHQKNRVFLEHMEELPVEDFSDGLLEKMAMQTFLSELNEEDRDLLLLYYWNESKMREIAKMREITEDGAKVKIFRARRKLKEKFGDKLLQNH